VLIQENQQAQALINATVTHQVSPPLGGRQRRLEKRPITTGPAACSIRGSRREPWF